MEELHITGNLKSIDYHKAKHIAQVRHQMSINRGYIIIYIYIYIVTNRLLPETVRTIKM